VTRRPLLLIIDPSIAWPEVEGAETSAGDWPGDVRVVRPALEPGTGPHPGGGYEADAVIVMGSRASVTDDLPWLADLRAWLGPLVSGSVRRPLLGICFGHQLIARLAGAPVGKVHEDGREERGVQESRFDDCRLVPGGGLVRVVASHGEEAKAVPGGFRAVSRRGPVAIDAFEHETLPVYGVQFHPEARASFLRKREMPPDPRETVAFEEQDGILSRFRAEAWSQRNEDRG
jgi:GMP synthase-like glutamine amidotransferase